MRHRAKFCADRSGHCGDMAVFDFSRWRPSAILDLLYVRLDQPRRIFHNNLYYILVWYYFTFTLESYQSSFIGTDFKNL